MRILGIIIFLLFSLVTLQAQTDNCSTCVKYNQFIQQGNEYLEAGRFDQALIEFQSAQVAARVCKCSNNTPAMGIEKAIQGIQEQKKEAERQRDAARRAILEAERLRRESDAAAKAAERKTRAATNALKILQVEKENPSLAVQLAEMNYHLYPESETGAGIMKEILKKAPQVYRKIQKGHTSAIISVAFSPEGDQVLTGSTDASAILWDLSGHALQSFSGHTGVVLSVTFSPNGEYVLTGSNDDTAILWNLQGQALQSFSGHTDAVVSVAFSPDGNRVLTGSYDNTAILWDLSGQAVQTFGGHTAAVLSVAFSQNGKHVLTGSRDDTAILWDLSGQAVQTFGGHKGFVMAVAFSTDGKYILAAGSGSFQKAPTIWAYFRRFQPLPWGDFYKAGLEYTLADIELLKEQGKQW